MAIQIEKIVFYTDAQQKKVGQEWTWLNTKMKPILWLVFNIRKLICSNQLKLFLLWPFLFLTL